MTRRQSPSFLYDSGGVPNFGQRGALEAKNTPQRIA